MNIERLIYFIDLTITLNYSETADRLYTTQSNVSKQVIALEKELNTVLFSRKHHKIELTKSGEVLLTHAKRITEDYSLLKQSLIPFQESMDMMLKIFSIPVMTNYNITGLLANFHHIYPDINLDIQEVESIKLLNSLDEGTCDISYIRIFNPVEKKYEKITCEYDQFAAVLPISHPLAQEKVVQLSSLKNDIFYQLDRNTQLIDHVYSLCKGEGFTPQIGYTGTRIPTILDFVSKEMGVSLMMENSVKPLNYPGIVVCPLDVTCESELAFIRLRDQKHSMASNSFWKFLADSFRKS